MSEVKKQHYVPQFYLRRFTEDGNQLFVFDKFTRTVFESNISNVAAERYFYDLHQDLVTNDVDRQVVEKALANLEMDFANVVDGVLKTVEKREAIDRDQRQAMAFHIILQYLRTQEFRKTFIELVEKQQKALLDMIIKVEMPNVSPDDYRVQVKEETVSLEHAKFMFNPAYLNSFVQILSNHIWFVGINETSQPLYTSDSPVVKRGHMKTAFMSLEGFDSEGIEIAFPLTPKCILVLHKDTFLQQYAGWDWKMITLSTEDVGDYNRLQVVHSYRQIYSPSNDFGIAERVCREFPEVCNPDRDRVEVI